MFRIDWDEKVLNIGDSLVELSGSGYFYVGEFTENLRPLDCSLSGRRIGAILARLGLTDKRRTSKGVRVYLSPESLESARASLKKLESGGIE